MQVYRSLQVHLHLHLHQPQSSHHLIHQQSTAAKEKTLAKSDLDDPSRIPVFFSIFTLFFSRIRARIRPFFVPEKRIREDTEKNFTHTRERAHRMGTRLMKQNQLTRDQSDFSQSLGGLYLLHTTVLPSFGLYFCS